MTHADWTTALAIAAGVIAVVELARSALREVAAWGLLLLAIAVILIVH